MKTESPHNSSFTIQTFFEKFDQFADAPDAVAKMRELVLELAVQGRLVPQHAKEETAHAMLNRVASTAKTWRQGADELEGTAAPFQIPETWAWVRLPRVLKKLTDGTHHSPPNGPSGDFMYVTAKNIKTDGVLLDGVTYVSKEVHDEIYSRCDPSFGDVLYIKDGATTGIATINQVKEPFSMLSSVALLKPSEAIFNRYLLWAMRSPFFYAETRGAMKGAAITRVTLSVMAASLLPLPPLAEQKRIVAKVDELMALCDQLEALQQERETQQAALSRASLARFAAEPSPANLDFVFHPAYTITPADLRKSILTLAVQGKLVPQDSSDEPSDLPASSRISKSKGEREVPFELPSNWKWMQLGQVSDLINGDRSKNYPNKAEYVPQGVAWINTGHIEPDGTLSTKWMNFITRQKFDSLRSGKVRPGDLVYCLRGATLGKTAIITQFEEGAVASSLVIIRLAKTVDPCFAFRVLTSPLGRDQIFEFDNGSAQPNLSANNVKKYWIPIPPLAEQRRIVNKVGELMILVDELELQMTTARDTAANLLSALVAELTAVATQSSDAE